MTGVGLARGTTELGEIAVEVRSVNGRGLAVKMRLAPACQGLEAALEARIRERVRRGNLTVVVDVAAPAPSAEPIVDVERARRAAAQLRALAQELQLDGPLELQHVLAVPGVIPGAAGTTVRVSWDPPPGVLALLDEALVRLREHRAAEGRATAAAVLEQVAVLAGERDRAAARAPAVIEAYRERLKQRVAEFLAGHARTLEDRDVLREVALYADRADVAEELERIAAHLVQIREVIAQGGEVGRKLEFLLQETLRETNTLGSKSQDSEIARIVVEMKSAIDRAKEQVANLE